MKIKVKSLFGNVIGITLWPFGIYVSLHRYLNDEKLINHEKIHWEQQKELLGLFFYLWYFIEWIIRLFINGKNAYRSLSFEQEAYDNDQNLNYLKTRKRYSWIKKIFKK